MKLVKIAMKEKIDDFNILFMLKGKVGVPSFQWISHEEN